MTREEKIEAFTMRLDGCTYQEIADKFGVTRQRVEQIVGKKIRKPRTGLREKGFLYPNLIEWMYKKEITITKLTELIGLSNYQVVTARLRGEKEFHIDEIDKILAASGMSYEFMFQRKSMTETQKRSENG